METTVQSKHWLISNQWERLAAINNSEYNIAIWQREPDELVMNLMPLLVEHSWPSIEGSGNVDDIGPQMDAVLRPIVANSAAAYHEFKQDILSLAHKFAALVPSSYYRWRIAKVQGNMCKRFHSDINDLRLLCTYYGPGTLWLPNDNINQTAMRKGLFDEIVIDNSRVEQAKAYEVVVLKGALHTHCTPGALIHRSPTIEELGQVRILFRLDTAGFGDF